MIRNYNQGVPSTQSGNIPMSSAQIQHPQSSHALSFPPTEGPVNLASKVAEVFLTAGHAFQKLGDLTLQLHSGVDPDECKWTGKDCDQLKESLTRFAHELDMISQSVQGRTTKHIKTDIKRRHLIPDEGRRPNSPSLKRPAGMPPQGMMAKRISVPLSTKPIPMGNRPLVSVPQRVSVAHSSQMNTPLLNDPSHHYINTG